VRVHGTLSQRALEALAEGVTVDGVRYGPIDASIERRSGSNLWLAVTLTEGKNREIRKVMEHLGVQVTRLIRVGYGPFALDELPVRGVDEITIDAVKALKERLKLR
jgi:23S rRNA pseudouridine2605 synthase